MSRLPPPKECANCGATIPRSARACPECGADERTGWRETSVYDGLELPDDDGIGDEGETPALGGTGDRRVNGIAWYWWCAAVALLLLLGLSAFALV